MSNAESIKEMADMAYALGTTHDPEQPSQQPSEGRVEATSVDEALGQLWAALEEARGNVEKARALSTGARPDGWSVGRLFTGELREAVLENPWVTAGDAGEGESLLREARWLAELDPTGPEPAGRSWEKHGRPEGEKWNHPGWRRPEDRPTWTSMGDLARALDVRPSRVSSWERLQERMPAALARQAAELLGVGVDVLKAAPLPVGAKPPAPLADLMEKADAELGKPYPREIMTRDGPAWVGPPPSGDCDGQRPHRWVSSHSVHGWSCVQCGKLRPIAPPGGGS